ncbi:MAG: hypothetical protein AAF203_09900 [Pseudomonadota bacterium]
MISNQNLISNLNQTIALLEQSSDYQWGSFGACNCGHLAQAMTGYHKNDLHRWAQEKKGEWSDLSEQYCESSGYKIDDVIQVMLKNGLDLKDIRDIEYLSNGRILEKLPGGKRFLERNHIDDVILYFQAWVTLLEEMQNQGEVWKSGDKKITEVEIYDSIPDYED